ncbi:MAG TPA: hypothetical protein VGJ35_00460 [Burkholderiaceae bacterium]
MSSFHFHRERGFAGLWRPSRRSAGAELPMLTDIVPSDSLLDAADDDAPDSTGFEVTQPGELCTLSFGRSRFG